MIEKQVFSLLKRSLIVVHVDDLGALCFLGARGLWGISTNASIPCPSLRLALDQQNLLAVLLFLRIVVRLANNFAFLVENGENGACFVMIDKLALDLRRIAEVSKPTDEGAIHIVPR